MKISDNGLRLIKSFEGYHKRLKNGDCAAYLCPARVATIGWGCTEGIKLGMVWTEKEAEEALLKEIAKFETGVDRLVTVEMNQNEFDALVSLSYNIGLGGFGRSSVLKHLNKGNRARSARSFEMWVKGGGRTLPGLVSRRKREAALFLKPVEAPEEPYMPQEVAPEAPPVGSVPVATIGVGGGVAVTEVIKEMAGPVIPVPPAAVTDSVDAVGIWHGIGTALSSFVAFAKSEPVIVGGIVVVVLAVIFLPRIVPEKWRPA